VKFRVLSDVSLCQALSVELSANCFAKGCGTPPVGVDPLPLELAQRLDKDGVGLIRPPAETLTTERARSSRK
jgi:hypothetical protein